MMIYLEVILFMVGCLLSLLKVAGFIVVTWKFALMPIMVVVSYEILALTINFIIMSVDP